MMVVTGESLDREAPMMMPRSTAMPTTTASPIPIRFNFRRRAEKKKKKKKNIISKRIHFSFFSV
jgi:hypothetical protein